MCRLPGWDSRRISRACNPPRHRKRPAAVVPRQVIELDRDFKIVQFLIAALGVEPLLEQWQTKGPRNGASVLSSGRMNWNGTKVVVTGAGGFIGSHLVDRLLELGANVTAFVRYNSRNDAGFLAPAEQLRIVFGDIRDPDAVREA